MIRYYNLEVAMLGENERNNALDKEIGDTLGFSIHEIDERSPYHMTATFHSNVDLLVMKCNVTNLLVKHPEIFYIDLIYRKEDFDSVPNRTVIWSDGRVKNYKGIIIYEEVK